MIIIRIVVKFGGTSIEDPQRIEKATSSIAKKIKEGHEVLVVVSAMGDTTDNLISLLEGVTKSGYGMSDYAQFVSFGERMSAQLMSASLRANDIQSRPFDPSEEDFPIITNEKNLLEADILPKQSKEQCQAYLEPLLKKGHVPVVCGFLGRSEKDSIITCLGRGGSDITAFALGNFIKADEVIIVTDASGVASADPRLIKKVEMLPVCTMNSGYSSGWVSESIGTRLVTTEILCRARGDECCRFVMASPETIEQRIKEYLRSEPSIAEHIGEYHVPGFFVRKRIEDALREREAQYRGVFEASTDALLIIAPDSTVIGANQAAEELFGQRRDQLEGTSIDELLPLRSDFETIEQIISAGDTFHSEMKLERGNEQVHVEVRGSSYEYKRHHHVLMSVRDITRQKQMQEQLYRADRLASLGTMAAGVAHEINNPLSFIISNLEVILWDLKQDDVPDLEDIGDAIRRAKKGAERVERTVRDLTNFSHGGLDDSVEPVNVHRMLDLATQMVEKTIEHKGGHLIKDYTNTPPVLANEARLNQVFVNLLLNAAQALPDSAENPNEVVVSTRVDTQQRVVVSVTDTGSGIPKNIRDRIFDPFFTTKPVDQGTGIGLSICHEIVKAIGGEISLESEVGEGTTFVVTLPTQAQFAAAFRE